MGSLQGSRICGGNTAYKRSKSDFYPTPPDVTFALMQQLWLPASTPIWEPACGEMHIVNELRREGFTKVSATDIQTGVDFLTCDASWFHGWIITNPPFSIADKFIERCAEIGMPFALLLKMHYWNAKKRFPLFCEHTPSHIYPLTWRPDFMNKSRGGGSPLLDMMWCVWDGRNTKFGETKYKPLERPKIEKGTEAE